MNTKFKSLKTTGLIAFVISLITFLVTFSTEAQSKQEDYWPTEGWRTATPESQGMNSELSAEMFRDINNNNIDIYSLLIVRNGYIIIEANRKHPDAIYPIHSCTKSFTSAVFGIALDKGYIMSVDQKIADFFPEILKRDTGSKKDSITLKHLLTMSSGLEWPESDIDYTKPENPIFQMKWSNNWVEFVLNKPVIQEPGSVFNYNSGCSYLLMAVLSKLGLDVEDFAQKNLFDPLGISLTQYTWNKDKHGILDGMGGLAMRPRDMAKFGYLYLKGGFWDGQQIIPKTWIEESTKEQITGKLGSVNISYGYQWWVAPPLFVAMGFNGQFIVISPEHELVLVITSNLSGSKIGIAINLLKKYIPPAIQPLMPLPENEKATDLLKYEIERFNKRKIIVYSYNIRVSS